MDTGRGVEASDSEQTSLEVRIGATGKAVFNAVIAWRDGRVGRCHISD